MKYLRMSMAPCLLFFITTLSLDARPGRAESQPSELDTLKQDLKTVKDDLAAIRKELGEIHRLLAQHPAQPQPPRPANVMSKVSVADNPSLGKPDAPVVVVEFSDYQCPFCQRFVQTTLPALKADYIETGKVRYVFRDFPIASIHPQARKAAEAAHCAGDQGKYWEMHTRLFQNQRALGVVQLKGYAREMGLNLASFEMCLDENKYVQKVDKNIADGGAAGISGTPSFFVGKGSADGTIEGSLIRGAQSITAFRQAIDRLLEGKTP